MKTSQLHASSFPHADETAEPICTQEPYDSWPCYTLHPEARLLPVPSCACLPCLAFSLRGAHAPPTCKSDKMTMVVVRLSSTELMQKLVKATIHAKLLLLSVRTAVASFSKPPCVSTTSTTVMAPRRKKIRSETCAKDADTSASTCIGRHGGRGPGMQWIRRAQNLLQRLLHKQVPVCAEKLNNTRVQRATACAVSRACLLYPHFKPFCVGGRLMQQIEQWPGDRQAHS